MGPKALKQRIEKMTQQDHTVSCLHSISSCLFTKFTSCRPDLVLQTYNAQQIFKRPNDQYSLRINVTPLKI